MQIRCAACGRVVTLSSVEQLPEACAHCGARPVPDRLGDFVLDRPLAAGGMGEVYLAHHVDLGTRVAVKLMPPSLGEDVSTLRERFAREARLQAAVDHPGVVRVLDCDVYGDRPYLVLEFVVGKSLRELLANGPLPIAEVARLGAEVADVLAAAHACNVLHRDIKPENVLRSDDGRVRVLDFGIARARDGDNPVTRTGEIVGTPEYMAPEQVLDAGDEVDERADVHALGVLVYELLTGQNPFHAANVFAVLKLIESLVPRPPSTIRSEVSPALDRAVLGALAKAREDRFATASEFAAALRDAVVVDSATASAARGRSRVHWGWVAMAGAALALFGFWLGGGLSATVNSDRDGSLVGGVSRPVEPSAFERGQARFARGEAFAAIADFEAAAVEVTAARDWAQLAWLTAYRVLPCVIGAPAEWADCDEVRRRRLFGSAVESEAAAASRSVARLLSHGDGRSAWARLIGAKGGGLDPAVADPEVRASLAHIAAHLACDDPIVLRRVTDQLPAALPSVVELFELRYLDPQARSAALLERVRRLPSNGPEHWLLQLLAAPAEGVAVERLQSCAEMAWLHGAGEAAVIWLCGQRHWQAQLAARGPNRAERERLLTLLAGCDAVEVPAAVRMQALIQGASGSAEDLRSLAPHVLFSPERATRLLKDRGVDLGSFEAMAVLVRAGNEYDPAVEPWSRLAVEPLRTRWREEVCGGVE